MQTETMANRGKLFTMRWREEEAAQAEAVAQRYGMTVAALMRMLIEREASGMGKGGDTTSDPFATKDEDRWRVLLLILRAIDDEGDRDPAPVTKVVGWVSGAGFGNDWKGWKAFPAMLNALRRGGYTAKSMGGYVLTEKGAAFVKENRGKW